MEVLYPSAIRRMELTNLKLHDVDTQLGALRCAKAKAQGSHRALR